MNKEKDIYTIKRRFVTLKSQKSPYKERLYSQYINLLSEARERERIIKSIVYGIRNSLDINKVLQATAEEIGRYVEVDRCIIAVLDKSSPTFALKSEYLASADLPSSFNCRFSYSLSEHWNERLFDKKEQIVIDDLDSYIAENNAEWMKSCICNVKSVLITPIIYKGDPLGVIIIHQLKNHKIWANKHKEVLLDIANQIAVAVKQAEFYSDLKKQAERENSLRKISTDIRNSLDINDIKKTVVNEIGQSLKADRVLIGEFDPLTQKFSKAVPGAEYLSSDSMRSLLGTSFEMECVKSCRTIFFENMELICPDIDEYIENNNLQGSAEAKFIEEYQIKSGIMLPILHSDEIMGIIAIHFAEKKSGFHNDDIEFLKALATQIGIALHQSRLYEAMKQTAEWEKLVRRIMSTIRSTLDLDEVLKIICDEIAQLFNAKRAIILEFPDKSDYKKTNIKREYKANPNIKGLKDFYFDPRLGEFWGKAVLDAGSYLAINNVQEYDAPDYFKFTYDAMEVKSIISFPIKQGNEKWGLFSLSETEHYRVWTQDDIELLEIITDQIYIAIKQAELYSLTKKQAERESALRKIIEAVRSSLDIDKIKRNIVEEVGKVFKADRCHFRTFNREKEMFIILDAEYLSSPEIESLTRYDSGKEVSQFFQAIHEKNRMVLIPDVDAFIENPIPDSVKHFLKDNGIKSNYAFAIYDKNDFIGVFVIQYTKNKVLLSDADIEMLKSVADQSGIAIRQAELYMETKKQAEKERLLRNAISAIKSSIGSKEAQYQVVTEIGKFFNADRCFLHEYDPIKQCNIPINVEYLASSAVKSSIVLNCNVAEEITYWSNQSIGNRQKVIVTDIDEYIINNNLKNTVVERFLSDLDIKSLIGIPMLYADQVLGTFVLHFSHKISTPAKDDMEFIETLANQMAISIHKSRLYDDLKEKAEREKLLRKLITTIRSTLDLDEVLKISCNEIAELFNTERVAIIDFPDRNDYGQWITKSEYKFNENIKTLNDLPTRKEVMQFWGKRLFECGDIVVINNILEYQEFDYVKDIYELIGIKSIVVAPIKMDNEIWGAIGMAEYTNFRNWKKEDIELLETIANHIYIAIRQAEMYSTIKAQLEKEKKIRSDDSIIINRELSNNIGLNSAITFSILNNMYNYLNDEGKLDSDGFFICNVDEIKHKTYLSTYEQQSAIESLAKTELIEYKKKNHNEIGIKILNDESFINQYIIQDQNTNIDSDNIDIADEEKVLFTITELCSIYSEYFSKNSVDAVKYFLQKSGQIVDAKNTKISRLYFAVICRTLYDFMSQYSLDLKRVKEVIDEWFSKKEYKQTSSIITFGVSNRILISRLKKILFYRLQEAKILAVDFYSKMDFYSNPEFEELNNLYTDNKPENDKPDS